MSPLVDQQLREVLARWEIEPSLMVNPNAVARIAFRSSRLLLD